MVVQLPPADSSCANDWLESITPAAQTEELLPVAPHAATDAEANRDEELLLALIATGTVVVVVVVVVAATAVVAAGSRQRTGFSCTLRLTPLK